MKNCNDNIGNRNRDLLACSAVPQPTAPPRAPFIHNKVRKAGYLPMLRVGGLTSDAIGIAIYLPTYLKAAFIQKQ